MTCARWRHRIRPAAMKRFEGTADYVATDDLKVAVNAAVTLRRLRADAPTREGL